MLCIYWSNKFGTSQQTYVDCSVEEAVTAIAAQFPNLEPVRKGSAGAFFRSGRENYFLIRPLPEVDLNKAVQQLKEETV